MSYRMTFRFYDESVLEEPAQVPARPVRPVSRIQLERRKVRRKAKRNKLHVSFVQWLSMFLFVLLSGVLLVAVHGHPGQTDTTVATVPGKAVADEALVNLAATYQLLILPPLNVWMVEGGVYDNRKSADFAVKSYRESGIAAYATPQPPYQVLLSPLLGQDEMKVAKSRWLQAEIPYYLSEWKTNQQVIPVPFFSHQQAGMAERQVLNNLASLQALLKGGLQGAQQLPAVQPFSLQGVSGQDAGAVAQLIGTWGDAIAQASSEADLAKATYLYLLLTKNENQ